MNCYWQSNGNFNWDFAGFFEYYIENNPIIIYITRLTLTVAGYHYNFTLVQCTVAHGRVQAEVVLKENIQRNIHYHQNNHQVVVAFEDANW